MRPNSNILREECNRIERIYRDEISNKRNLINDLERQNETLQGEIQEAKKAIEKYDNNKRNRIYALREIMENEENHEDNLICRPLQEAKKREYEKEINDLNIFLNTDYNLKYPLLKNNIEIKRRTIMDNKRKIMTCNETIENFYKEAIENGRRVIIGNTIDILRENQATEDQINYLQEMMINNGSN